jgi:hypothetical protein
MVLMKRVTAGSLGLLLALLALEARADDSPWRPATTTTAASSADQAATLGRPTAVAATDSSAEPLADLGRPVAPSAARPARSDDSQVVPVTYTAGFGQPQGLIARAKGADSPQPMPTGPPVKGPTITEGPEIQPGPVAGNGAASVSPPVVEVAPGSIVHAPPGAVVSVGPDACADGSCGPECAGGSCATPCDDATGCCCCDGCCCENAWCGPHFWIRAEYLLWMIKHAGTPPLVSSGPQASLGALSQPGAFALFGGALDHEDFNGGRFTIGAWLDPNECWGIEGSGFFLGQRSVTFAAASGGDPVLARPIISAFTGAEGVEQVANLQEVINGIGVLPVAGSIRIDAPSQLWGAELNGLYNVHRGDFWRMNAFGGFRYLDLREALNITEDIVAQPVAPFPAGVPFPPPSPAGTEFIVRDSFATRNQFYGGQLGLRNEWSWNRWQLDLTGKVAVGDTHQIVDINGNTTITVPGMAPVTANGGLLALPTNIGHYNRNRLTVVPELNLNLGYQITDHWRVYIGYDLMYWSSVVRPGEQIDRVVNVTQVPSLGGGPGTLVGPARPTFFFHGSDFWAQGANVGVEFRY